MNWAGIEKGDTVLIQANTGYLRHKYNCSLKDMVESILSIADTLVVPTFNTAFNDGLTYDIRTAPSKMGDLSEFVRCKADSVRSGHPSYSFCALGKNAELFDVNNFSGYGKDSPFAILRRLNGKIGVLGLENSMGNSILHHVEELHRVPYRKYKNFSGNYIDRYGEMTFRTYSFFCNGGYKTLLDPLDGLLWAEGLYKGDKPFEGDGFRSIEAQKLFDFVWKIIDEGKAEGILYK